MRRPALAVFALAGLPALWLYLSTLAPSLTWAHAGADGGDLISAALSNGVPHPPGYPTYITLGQIVARLPWGDAAYRFNVFSAACMALAVGFTALTLWRLLPALPLRATRECIAVIAALFLAAAPMVWGQATIAEVHALNAAFVAVIVYLLTPIVFRGEPISPWRMTAAAWLWGLALGNALTSAALAPLIIAAWWRGRVSSAARSFLPLAGFLAGISIYAWLPFRAAQQPFVNWGDAVTLERFILVMTAELYRGYALGATPFEWGSRLVALAQALVTQYGWLGVIVCGMGCYAAAFSPNRQWRWLAAVMALYVLFALTYSPADSALYLIPVWMFGAWAIARGLLTVIGATKLRARAGVTYLVLASVFLGGPALTVWQNFVMMDLRGDHRATDFARQVLTQAPSDAVVITEADGQTFALWYHRTLTNARPDLAIVDRRLAGYPWYAAMLRAQSVAPFIPDVDPAESWLRRLIELNPDRPICLIDAKTELMTCP